MKRKLQQARQQHFTQVVDRVSLYPKPYRDAYCWCQALYRLGFANADVHLVFASLGDKPDMLHVRLETQGKTYNIGVQQLPGLTADQVEGTWRRFVEVADVARNKRRQDLEKMWRDSPAGQLPGQLLEMGLRQKGFVIPGRNTDPLN